MNVVGELDGLVLPVLQHHQLDDRPLPVHRMHRKLHPDRASGRVDAGVRRKFSGSAKPTPEHFGMLRSILKYKGVAIGRMRSAVNCYGNSTPIIIDIHALRWLQKDLLEVFLQVWFISVMLSAGRLEQSWPALLQHVLKLK